MSLGIHLRRHPRIRAARTRDDHAPLGKRVLGAAHRAFSVTVSPVPDTQRCAHADTPRARCTHVRAHHSTVTHEGWAERLVEMKEMEKHMLRTMKPTDLDGVIGV